MTTPTPTSTPTSTLTEHVRQLRDGESLYIGTFADVENLLPEGYRANWLDKVFLRFSPTLGWETSDAPYRERSGEVISRKEALGLLRELLRQEAERAAYLAAERDFLDTAIRVLEALAGTSVPA